MTAAAPAFVDSDHNVSMTFYVYRYDDGSVQIRKPHDNEVATQSGIHTINMTADEARSLARILSKPRGITT